MMIIKCKYCEYIEKEGLGLSCEVEVPKYVDTITLTLLNEVTGDVTLSAYILNAINKYYPDKTNTSLNLG